MLNPPERLANFLEAAPPLPWTKIRFAGSPRIPPESDRGAALALFSTVLISLFPRVTGLKLENAWGRGSERVLRCTARLSRSLRPEEWERVERLPKTRADGNQVTHECRPEEIEWWHTQLVEALSASSAPIEGRAAAAGQRSGRSLRKRRGVPPREPAA